MKWYIIIACFLTVSCSRDLDRGEKPEGLLTEEKMVDVITDMITLEAHIQLRYSQVGRYHKVMKASGDSLLATHKVTPEEYSKSMDYYSVRQDEMQTIYNDVMNRLNDQLGKIQAEDSE